MGRFGKNKFVAGGDCPFCHGSGTMFMLDDKCYACSNCAHTMLSEYYEAWCNGENIEVETVYDESYEEIYDEDGSEAYVICNYCRTNIRFKDGQYICPNCNTVIDRATYFNYIGANPPSEKCLSCDSNYPHCIWCPNGYKQ